jgi:glycosyltransferase involved in cell wall biosynthesis
MTISTLLDSDSTLKMRERKTLLCLSWRDIGHPEHGGAEVLTHQILSRLDQSEFEIVHISAGFDGGALLEEIDGVRYLREGNTLTLVWHAMIWYRKNRRRVDLVVDQCNTHRFFSFLWVARRKRLFFIHQLTREIWFYQKPGLVGWLGYLLEPLLLWLQRKDNTVTVSSSTRNDLIRFGFDPAKITVIPEGINFLPWRMESMPEKMLNTFIFVNRFAPYKGLTDSFHALALVRKTHPDACIRVLGNGQTEYLENVLYPLLKKLSLSYGDNTNCGYAVVFMGFVTEDKKLMQMSISRALLYPSVREGWGLSITEAAAVGTPSIVYPAPGTIDAVAYGEAGYLCDSCSVTSLAQKMTACLDNQTAYSEVRSRAYEFSKKFHFDHSAAAFSECIARTLLVNDRPAEAPNRKCDEAR